MKMILILFPVTVNVDTKNSLICLLTELKLLSNFLLKAPGKFHQGKSPQLKNFHSPIARVRGEKCYTRESALNVKAFLIKSCLITGDFLNSIIYENR